MSVAPPVFVLVFLISKTNGNRSARCWYVYSPLIWAVLGCFEGEPNAKPENLGDVETHPGENIGRVRQ